MLWRIVMIEDAKTRFCRRLKTIRKSKKLTQEGLGVKIGLDESCANTRISRYEKGVHVVEPNTAERIAQVLDVPLSYFYAPSEDLAELNQLFHHFNSEDQQKLLIFAQSLSMTDKL